MSSYRSDPTANTAIGAVDREIERMRREAARLGRLRRRGMLSSTDEAEARKQFTVTYIIMRYLVRQAIFHKRETK